MINTPTLAFLRAILHSPGEIGAVAPSSSRLAKAMAAAAQSLDRGGLVIEAGPGSGALTGALVEAFGYGRLRVVEQSSVLSSVLQARYPGLAVENGRIEQALDECGLQPDNSLLISSIPFKSLAPAQTRLLSRRYIEYVQAGGRVLQFSYGRQPPFSTLPGEPGWRPLRRVWWNLPPARLWVLAATPGVPI
ncbi:hypothetical protein FNU76_07935 [Chitinimonas arctica]|uniref:Uncharacterized protein n=1 Tax=Chitinimonas arctica TaxID=2594795 RepID=A0A516SDS2_9NEIS|nr:hypothetical protein [Chitinimonas arctica]QDQ26296.1 hypothetical protein FNU76_07935 [Chitinimonas arctica]